MSILPVLAEFLSWMGWSLVPFLLVMNLIVFIHEYGHYIVGRWCGVKVEVFSLGFGPELLHRIDRHGTRWRLALFPIGGYVKFLGDADAASGQDSEALAAVSPADRSLTLAAQPVYERAAIVAAGPAANFLLAMVLLTGMFSAFGHVVHTARIGDVVKGSPGEAAGFLKGDLVTAINGEKINTYEELYQASRLSTGIEMTFDVERGGDHLTLRATPTITSVDLGPLGKRRIGRIGLAPSVDKADEALEHCGPVQCVGWAADQVGFITRATVAYIGGLFMGRESVDQMSSVVGMTQMTGAVAHISGWDLLNLAALFSVSIGLMNLFPIPLLDGGHLMFFLVEAIIGRPVSERVQQVGLRIGIALVGGLMIFTLVNDILRPFVRS